VLTRASGIGGRPPLQSKNKEEGGGEDGQRNSERSKQGFACVGGVPVRGKANVGGSVVKRDRTLRGLESEAKGKGQPPCRALRNASN